MNSSQSVFQAKLPAAVRAEAALWLAHLRGPERNADVEQGFRLWLNAKPEHARAFEMATDLWEKTAAVRRHPHERNLKWKNPARLHRSPIAALAATLAVVTIGILVWYLQRDSVTTAIGEQRTITLDDGSRIFLNTDTRAVVQYSSGERRIRLDKGEALFEVAKQAGRPFIVAAGMARIEALGTSFVVRRDPQRLAVTLVDGKVSVASMETGEQTPPLEQARILSPGERLTIARRGAPILDAPRLDKLTAWQQGQIAFDSVPLADAVAEMNRYGATKLFIERPEAAGIHIGGIFRTGDAVSFAAAMVETYQLKAVEERGRIILAGAPKTPGISKRRPK